jgi:hypothetical protein
VLYEAADLPATIKITAEGIIASLSNKVFSLGGTPPTYYTATTEGFNWRVIFDVESTGWYVLYQSQDPDLPEWGQLLALYCLIDVFDPEIREVVDQFEPTYTVGEVTLERDSLCTWRGGGRVLRYNSATCKFQLNGVEKTGDQNKPDGTYGEETVV